MYQPHAGLQCEITDDVVIWRYMDFTKYIDFLTSNSLWFARLNTLGDPFEGTYTAENHARFALMADREVLTLQNSSKEEQENRLNLIKGIPGGTARRNRACTYVSCWHNNDYESAAMWKLYLKSDEGIAIRSTTRRLVDCLAECPETIHIGRVKYIDYSTEAVENDRGIWNALDGVIHKRISFAHEKEIRAIMHKPDLFASAEEGATKSLNEPTLPGYAPGIGINALVESVYVSPTAPDWFYKLVKTVSARFLVSGAINRSSLSDKPLM